MNLIPPQICLALLAASCLSASLTLAQSTFVFTLESPSNGQTIGPGQSVSWSITSTSDSGGLGLAGFTIDLVQDAANPQTIELPPAGSVPSALAGFSRPAGISNPSPGGGSPGYCGTPVGITGYKDLKEIGGIQNTFGISGGVFGQDVAIESGIGTGTTGHVLASGSFAAPAAEGVYVFRLANGFANEIVLVSTAPAPSAAMDANIVFGGSLSFTVAGAACDADVNCDFALDGFDVESQERAVSGDMTDYCLPDPDFNGDFALDGFDVEAVELVVGGGPCP